MTFADPMVAQKVVSMPDHVIRKSNLNVSYADPRGGPKAPQFTTDPFAMQLGYTSGLPRHPAVPTPRYPFSGQQQQQQQQQTYAMGYAAPQHMAVQRPDSSHSAMVSWGKAYNSLRTLTF